jgi:hypothetical protein
VIISINSGSWDNGCLETWIIGKGGALRKTVCHFSPLASFKAACINLHPTGEEHTPHVTPLLTSWEHNPEQPPGRENPLNKTEKYKQMVT